MGLGSSLVDNTRRVQMVRDVARAIYVQNVTRETLGEKRLVAKFAFHAAEEFVRESAAWSRRSHNVRLVDDDRR